jgi:hypothetical protein
METSRTRATLLRTLALPGMMHIFYILHRDCTHMHEIDCCSGVGKSNKKRGRKTDEYWLNRFKCMTTSDLNLCPVVKRETESLRNTPLSYS